ncbi:MAG: PA-phosphatase-like [Planctomycetota bacterium]|nr:MAG: PA-phosphatase-like [Planctomycetota bacterium]
MKPSRWRLAVCVAACAMTALALPVDAAVSQWFEAHRRGGLNAAALGATSAWTLGAFVWAACAGLAFLKHWKQALLVGATTGVSLAIGSLVKLCVNRERPYKTLEDFVALTAADDASFPSNHTNGAFAAAIVLGAFLPRLRPAFFLFAAGIALTRLYVGVHFFSDVCGGIALALLSSTVALGIAEAKGLLPVRAVEAGDGAGAEESPDAE